METVLPWQQESHLITQLYESILSLYLAHTFFVTICGTGLACSYGNIVTMAARGNCAITQLHEHMLY